MAARDIYITEFDMDRLMSMIEGAQTGAKRNKEHLAELERELLRGKLVEPEQIPRDVITMNSKVIICDRETGEKTTYTLVFPADANLEQNKLSILAPLGTALLGYRKGDIIEWEMPSGVKKIEVLDILYQPEAAGKFDL